MCGVWCACVIGSGGSGGDMCVRACVRAWFISFIFIISY